MGKFVIETVQILKSKYYVEEPDSNDSAYALHSLVNNELDPFSSQFFTEEVLSVKLVDEFPVSDKDEDVNAAVMVYDIEAGKYKSIARWDLNYDEDIQ